MSAWVTAFKAIVTREALRFVHQRERFVAALVRPLVWLLVFAAGFRAALGLVRGLAPAARRALARVAATSSSAYSSTASCTVTARTRSKAARTSAWCSTGAIVASGSPARRERTISRSTARPGIPSVTRRRKRSSCDSGSG